MALVIIVVVGRGEKKEREKEYYPQEWDSYRLGCTVCEYSLKQDIGLSEIHTLAKPLP